MRPLDDGWHELAVAAASGEPYRVRAAGRRRGGGPGLALPGGRCARPPALVVDPAAYRWQHAWLGRPWHEAVIYELHVGTFTPEGTFRAAIERLPHLAELGVTALELMPLADFPGRRNWGYDGVLPFAPDRSYGAPEDLKALIDAAHGHGLMVLLDVVYNHFGPEGNYLTRYAPRLLHRGLPHALGCRDRFPASRRCATSTSTTRSTGSRNTASTACASMPCTRSSTRARPTSWSRSRGRSEAGPAPESIWCSRTSTTRPPGSVRTRRWAGISTMRNGTTTCTTSSTRC